MLASILLGLYICFLIYLGYSDYSKKQDITGFTVADRKSSAFTVGMSIIASCVGGSATIGMVALSYKIGFAAIWWLLSGAIGLSVLTFFVSKKVRETGARTMPMIIESIAGKKASLIVSVIIVIAWSAILAAQFSASARILSSIMSANFELCLIISALVVSVYALLGGQSSVLKSDVYQYFMVIIALLGVFVWMFFFKETSLGGVEYKLINEKFTYNDLLYYIVIQGGSYVVGPMLFARLLSAKDENSAFRGAIFGVVGIVLSAIVIVFIGLGASTYLSGDVVPDAILTSNVFNMLPVWLGILLLFGLFSAIISSADSCLITASIVLSHDVIKTKSIKTYRIVTFVLGMLALMLSFYGKSIIGWLFAANDIYVSGVVAPVFIMILAYKKRKIDELFIILAMVFGGGFGLIAALSEVKMYSFIGVGASILFALIAIRSKLEVSAK